MTNSRKSNRVVVIMRDITVGEMGDVGQMVVIKLTSWGSNIQYGD